MKKTNLMPMLKSIFLLAIITSLTFNNLSAAVIKGKILDKENKPFQNAGLITVVNNLDGSQEIKVHTVDNNGDYSISVNHTGFMQIVFGIDTVDKFLIPMFVNNNQNYSLDMKLPHTQHPYIDFREVTLNSTTPNFVENIRMLFDIFNSIDHIDMYHRGLNHTNDTADFGSKIKNEAKSIIEKYKQTKDIGTKFVIGTCYINVLNFIKDANNPELISQVLIQDYLTNFNHNTEYLHSFAINYDNIADLFPEGFSSEYLTNISKKNNSPFVRSEVLAQAIIYYFDKKNDRENGEKFYYRLQNEYPDSEVAFYASLKYDPNKKIQVGKQLPQFIVQSQDDQSLKFNNKYFENKYLFIHFWATQSEESIFEINELNRAMHTFGDKNFEIMSISLDKDWQSVIEYRNNRIPMLWRHGWEPNGGDGILAKTFELYKIPFGILVSPDGKILELDNTLQGRRIMQTLSKYFK